MANLQSRKRRDPDEANEDIIAAKRVKLSAVQWDKLSKVWLTPRALREHNRRNNARPPSTSPTALSGVATTLTRFARSGGPDLQSLRGYRQPKNLVRMTSNRSSASSNQRTQSTQATSVTTRVSAHDKNFEQSLIEKDIFPKGYAYPDDEQIPEPGNLDDIVQELKLPRASLSPSQFSNSAFRDFSRRNDAVVSESKLMSMILPTMQGNAEIPNEQNLAFTNLDSITDGTTVDAVPDSYDGAYAKDINKAVRQDLNKFIIPTSHGLAPVAANFFVEAKAPRGGADVVKRQACLDGAVGARTMHSLQNYKDKPVYDGNAYSFSSTYHAGTGTLQLYGHHPTKPISEGKPPQYHMTQLRAYALTSDRESCVQGLTAFRNMRDLAKRQRDTFIRAANAKAMPPASDRNVSEQEHELRVSEAHGEETSWQDSHDDLQQHIAQSLLESPDITVAKTAPQRYDSSDDEEQSRPFAGVGSDDPSTSLTSSFSSSFSANTMRQKRSRKFFSSPTQESRSSKSRSRPIPTSRPLTSPATSVESRSSRIREWHWVKTYESEGKILFRNPEDQLVETESKDWEEAMKDGSECWCWRSSKTGELFWTMELPKIRSVKWQTQVK